MSRLRAALSRRAQSGMTLVEVLVTAVIISVGLLGVAALQLTSLKSNQESYVRSQAAMLAADLLDRMRANQAGVRANHYDMARANGFDQRARRARLPLPTSHAWQATINRLLPGDDTAMPPAASTSTATSSRSRLPGESARNRPLRAHTIRRALPRFQTRSEI